MCVFAVLCRGIVRGCQRSTGPAAAAESVSQTIRFKSFITIGIPKKYRQL